MKREGIRICVIDRHPLIRIGVGVLLEKQPGMQLVGEAEDCRQAIEITMCELPDIFVVDDYSASEPAVESLKELLSKYGARAILLAGVVDEERIYRAIQAGITGLVYKYEHSDVLLHAIKKVHSGEGWLSRAVMTTALSRLARLRKAAPDNEGIAAKMALLTRRESEIVAVIAGGANRRKAAEMLFVSETTIRNHLSSIYTKLGVSGQFELVFLVRRYGGKVAENKSSPLAS